MIKSKVDLKEFKEADKFAIERSRNHPLINDYIWRFLIALRHSEYWYYRWNKSGGVLKDCVSLL